MESVKDLVGLDVLRIHKIPCVCSSDYIGQMGRSVSSHKKKRQSCLQLGHVEQSALAQACWSTLHKHV